MKKNHAQPERFNEELDLFFFDVADLLWQWFFWLTLAVLTRLMWVLLDPSENDGNIPMLLEILLTNISITITVKFITSCRKLRWKNDRNRILMVRHYHWRNNWNRLGSSVSLAFKKAVRRKSKN